MRLTIRTVTLFWFNSDNQNIQVNEKTHRVCVFDGTICRNIVVIYSISENVHTFTDSK